MSASDRQSLYSEDTSRIIAELEEGRLPWVQPWDASRCPVMMPHSGVSGRVYSGINALILWGAGMGGGYLAAWLDVLRADEKAIFRAASPASKGADFLLSFGEDRP